ncbi:MAG: hypothetical protein IJV15_09845 [Lachnospiraceae bacterium]|nr:hypothetical protein [Lachnospiraceae bacterium]
MGFFDNILKTAAKSIDNAIGNGSHDFSDLANKAFQAKEEAIYGTPSGNTDQSAHTPIQTAPAASHETKKSFNDKLNDIISGLGYSIETNISPSVIENYAGKEIYARRRNYAAPDNISYGIVSNGSTVLYIRLWKDYKKYDHIANRQIKVYCDMNGIKMLDFFDYLPNETGYMTDRIKKELGI